MEKWDNLTKVTSLIDRGAGYTSRQVWLWMPRSPPPLSIATLTLCWGYLCCPPDTFSPYGVFSLHPLLKYGHRCHPSSLDIFLHLVLWWGGNDLTSLVLCKFVGIYSIDRLRKGKEIHLSPRSARMQVHPGYRVACYLCPPTTNIRAKCPFSQILIWPRRAGWIGVSLLTHVKILLL